MRETEAAARDCDERSLLGRSQLLEAQAGRSERPRDSRAVLPVTERHDEQGPARVLPERVDAGKDGVLRGAAGDERVTERGAPNALARREAEGDLAQRERVAARDVDDFRDHSRRQLVAETPLEKG